MKTMKTRPIVIVQGGQWGSEAKGAIALKLAKENGVSYAVRTGSVNAGHTIVRDDGAKFAFQQLPTPSVLPGVTAVIGPGAYVNQEILMREVEAAGCRDRILIDGQCGVHLEEYMAEAATEARNLRIGATGKGCAEAIMHKIADRNLPGTKPLLLRERWAESPFSYYDTAAVLTDAYYRNNGILIEGTQGSLLDFHCGPYPFVTSRQTTAAAWVAEAGLSPALQYEVVLVLRTYPIRVAGNSGPMGRECTWPYLARKMNKRLQERGYPPIVSPDALHEFEFHRKAFKVKDFASQAEFALKRDTLAIVAMSAAGRNEIGRLFETTTVTKRLRRVAEFDVDQVALTVKKEQPAYAVLTFLNYVFPELVYERTLHQEAVEYVADLQAKIGCWIRYVSIGPRTEDVVSSAVARP